MEPLSFSISVRNKFSIVLVILLSCSSCGPIPEETAHAKALKDSAEADSIMKIEAGKIKHYKMMKKRQEDSIKRVAEALELAKIQDTIADTLPKNLQGKLKEHSTQKLMIHDSLPHYQKIKKISPEIPPKPRVDSTN